MGEMKLTIKNYKNASDIYHYALHKTSYEVPFVILNSKLTATKFIDVPRNGLSFLDFFAQWTGIKDELLLNNCNFVSEDVCPDSSKTIIYSNELNYLYLENEPHNYFK